MDMVNYKWWKVPWMENTHLPHGSIMWKAFIIALTVFNAVASLPTSHLNEDIDIVGGHEIDIKDAPHQVWLLSGCGGSVVSKDFILTAAHCVVNGRRYKIRAGSSDRTIGGEVVNSLAIRHPKYGTDGLDYDIALLKLEKPLNLSNSIKIIKMADKKYEVPAGDLVVVTGWGKTSTEPGSHIVEILQSVKVPIVSHEDCEEAYGGELTSNMVCAGETGKDSCQGDSGGPLVHKDTLVGVVSFGKSCALEGYPGVYAGVAAFRDWIDENMK